jgi:hypothetical protein
MDLSRWSHLVADWEYYKAHQSELVTRYNGKFLVLHSRQVAGAFETDQAADDFGLSHFGSGQFIIQKCSAGDKDLVVKLHPAIRF